MKHDVTFQRDDYDQSLYAWTLADDVVAGQSAVKSKKTVYLPKPNPCDLSVENSKRYDQYLARAVFYNATGRTLQGLVGAAFRKDPSLDVPSVLDYVSEDIDGAGISIYQQSQSALRGVLKKGRHALLVDYPQVEGQATRADMVSGRLRSTVVSIRPEQIVNWRTKKVGAEHKLSLIVICESVEEPTEDGFGVDVIEQYRVLRLETSYTQEIWRKNGKDKWVLYQEPVVILDGTGRAWDEIPITFIGSNNNDSTIDPSPMYDMAEINIAHYRNSADYEDSAYFVGQAQPWMAGLTEEWRDWMEKNGVYVGSRSPVLLPEGGQYGIAQAQPNTLVREAMQDKEQQLISLGARLVQPGTAVKTATQSQGEQEAEHSVLSLACSNVSDAYTKVLSWMARFMAANDAVEYQIQQDFVEQRLDAQMLTALVGAWQSGKYPESDLWDQLKKYGLIDPEKDDEAIREELDTQDQGLDLDGDIPAVN